MLNFLNVIGNIWNFMIQYIIQTVYRFLLPLTDAAIQLIRNALTAGIKADYVLMDTWFTTEPMLKNILDTGIHAIGMVKQLQQRYTYNGRQYTQP